jgi:hypothetical protein
MATREWVIRPQAYTVTSCLLPTVMDPHKTTSHLAAMGQRFGLEELCVEHPLPERRAASHHRIWVGRAGARCLSSCPWGENKAKSMPLCARLWDVERE